MYVLRYVVGNLSSFNKGNINKKSSFGATYLLESKEIKYVAVTKSFSQDK